MNTEHKRWLCLYRMLFTLIAIWDSVCPSATFGKEGWNVSNIFTQRLVAAGSLSCS